MEATESEDEVIKGSTELIAHLLASAFTGSTAQTTQEAYISVRFRTKQEIKHELLSEILSQDILLRRHRHHSVLHATVLNTTRLSSSANKTLSSNISPARVPVCLWLIE